MPKKKTDDNASQATPEMIAARKLVESGNWTEIYRKAQNDENVRTAIAEYNRREAKKRKEMEAKK